jgi:hypothetical protein
MGLRAEEPGVFQALSQVRCILGERERWLKKRRGPSVSWCKKEEHKEGGMRAARACEEKGERRAMRKGFK